MSLPPATVAAALAHARACGLARLDAFALLGHVLARPRTWLLAHDDAALANDQAAAWQSLVRRRAAGEPLAYLLGVKEFHGLELQVDPRVLVPRPETEELVDWALERLGVGPGTAAGPTSTARRTPVSVIDLGTGSGAIAVALTVAARAAGLNVAVHASDASRQALAVAGANAARHRAAIGFREGSWWSPWDGLRFELAVSNPPYVAAGDEHLPGLRHEPAEALVSGDDGLCALREIVARAPDHLVPGGWLLLEHGWNQAGEVQALLQAAGFTDVVTRRDLAGQPRCTGGRRRAVDSLGADTR